MSQRTEERDEYGETTFKYGVIDQEGKEIIPIEYTDIREQDVGNNGLIAVQKKSVAVSNMDMLIMKMKE